MTPWKTKAVIDCTHSVLSQTFMDFCYADVSIDYFNIPQLKSI